MFIRVREPEQMLELGNKLGRALHLFTGFVFPKFSMLNAEHYLDTLTKLSQESGIVLYKYESGKQVKRAAELVAQFEHLLRFPHPDKHQRQHIAADVLQFLRLVNHVGLTDKIVFSLENLTIADRIFKAKNDRAQ